MSLLVLAAGCGRGGLGDFDYPGDGSLDTDLDDTSVFDTAGFDTASDPDTFVFDSDFPVDTSVDFDSGTFDTLVDFDTGTFDTFVPPFDTGTVDTFVDFDTGTFDTFVDFDTGTFDTGVFDTKPDAPPEGGILCGSTFCSASTEECCASFTGVSCVKKGSCMGGTTLGCSSAASSPAGRVCCFGGFGGGTPTATCQPFCFGLQLCATDTECRPPQRCRVTFGGYGVCR